MRSNLRDALFAAGLIVFLVVAAAAAFLAGIAGLAAVLAVIVAAAFGVPALGFAWRTRQKRQADSHADFLTHHDPLTEILNRTRFMRDLDEAVALGCAVAVHAVEIDRFKEINDTTGQAVGDDILQQVARRLMSVSDRTDLVARIGGNEFALAHIVESPRQVTRTAVRILGALGETYHLASRDVDASVCVGSAVAPAHGETAAALLKNVEIALAHAKSEGLGSRALFRPKMDVELQERRTLERFLHNALKSDGLELHFQPIRSASNVRLAGFEALLRLPKPGGGQVSPTQFVPVAERLGLIVPKSATGSSAAPAPSRRRGRASSPSRSTSRRRSSPTAGIVRDRAAARSRRPGWRPERLELEITEGLLMSHAERHAASSAS